MTDTLPVHSVVTVAYKGYPVKVMRAVDAVIPTGEFGPWESSKADAAVGERMLNACAVYIEEFAREFVKAKLHPARKPLG